MAFVQGVSCAGCGLALPGDSDGVEAFCDACLNAPPPWHAGRAALAYKDGSRRFVLALKHGDRPELAIPASDWLYGVAADWDLPNKLLVPVPLHWRRMFKRRYNQSAELARALASRTGSDFAPQALFRNRHTPPQDAFDRDGRFANVQGSILVHPKHGDVLNGRDVCLIDDVMTTGATLAEATSACFDAGACRVFVLVLARAGNSS